MKNMYWHAHNLPRIILIAFCAFVLAGLFLVEYYKVQKPQPYYETKLRAASIAYKAFSEIKKARRETDYPIDGQTDPQRSGLIGQQFTPITSDSGDLKAKQTTINPNIAALFVQWMKDLKIKPGANVAVSMTGSFPALDISMLAALKAMEVNPIIVFSSSASQYGANLPNFSWLYMYNTLEKAKIFNFKHVAVTLGGRDDKAFGMNEEGRNILLKTVKRFSYPFLDSQSTLDGINKRMAMYAKAAGKKGVSLYINVGGGAASIGIGLIDKKLEKENQNKPHSLPSGLVERLPIDLANTDSVAVRYLKRGIPVINMHNVHRLLTEEYSFPNAPKREPLIGTGSLFNHEEYDTWLALAVLIADILVFAGIAVLSKKYVIRYKR